jgi:Protein of unknown function (DUF2281)
MTLLEQIERQVRNLPPEKQVELLDFVTFLQQRVQATHSEITEEERRKRFRKAFETLAEMRTFSEIIDPVELQRQIRSRPLPGRDS